MTLYRSALSRDGRLHYLHCPVLRRLTETRGEAYRPGVVLPWFRCVHCWPSEAGK